MRWKFSTIYSLGIGQGEISIIPIQMANFAAMIANRGYYYSPHLVRNIGLQKRTLEKYKVKHQTTINPKYFKPVIDGMEQVVQGGTAAWTRSRDSVIICGKTGTAENPHGDDHSVYIAFAPKDNPKIAIAVFVENAGFGAMTAAPIATLLIHKYLKRQTNKYMEDYVIKKDLTGKYGSYKK
jgi:penicillin-binding protein 2